MEAGEGLKWKILLAYMLLLLSILLGIASQAEIAGFIQSYLATAPNNPGVYGTSTFFEEAAKRWGATLAGSVDELRSISGVVVYVVIGPDRPFTLEEGQVLESLAREGRLKLVVMDETIVSNWLSERFLATRVSGEEVASLESPPGWQYILEVDCPGIGSGLASKPSYIESTAGEVVCWVDTGESIYPLAALIRGPVPGLVVADSSLCANFMATPQPWSGEGNLELCASLLSLLVEEEDVVVFDASHYKGLPIQFKYGQAVLGVVVMPVRALGLLWALNPEATFSLILVASAAVSIILVRPWRKSPVKYEWSDLEERLAFYAVEEAAKRDLMLRLLLMVRVAEKIRPIRSAMIRRASRVIGAGR
ncbi:MAG: hypothetical protein F7B20_03240 [Aeropyrum sp.]|nr:hypothetical protein [Aeropyrum sp.]